MFRRVTSLAKTASDVVDDIIVSKSRNEGFDEELEDLRDAVHTVARRSDSLTQFVDSYRQITRLAPPEKKRTRLAEMFDSESHLELQG